MKSVRFTKAWLMYQPGETAGFPAPQADEIISRGYAVDPNDVTETAAPAPVEEDPVGAAALTDRQAMIADIIETLDPSEDFTVSGKPEVGAINALLSNEVDSVTAEERDAVWLMVSAEVSLT